MDLKSYYSQLSDAYPDDNAKAVGWFNAHTQQLRFVAMAQLCDFEGRTVLDIGCGIGDFYGYLKSQGVACDYTGLDLSNELLDRARECYPDGEFLEGDFFSDHFDLTADFVVASGVMSMLVSDPETHLREGMSRLFQACRKGCAFNLLSVFATDEEKTQGAKRFCYYDPADVMKIALEVTPFAVVRQDYLPNDFTVVMSTIQN